MTDVRFEHISKSFGPTVALHPLDLTIKGGELFFLLGPSGCGKSTLLRLLAGLHEPTAGRLFFGDRDVTRLPTEKRNAVMCFQSYALWPHMTVRDNVRFGLDVRNVKGAQASARVDEVLHLVRMDAYADRKPNQLSGGQQQRVALARALAVKPDCLLLDEPLSNLDAKLRHEMRSEIRRICKTAGFTTVYVTHDQKEALSVADRIAVLKDGTLLQVGTPDDLYHRPATSFVADFIGQTNLISGTVTAAEGERIRIQTPAGELAAVRPAGTLGNTVMLSIRPEAIGLGVRAPVENRLLGRLTETTFLGESSEHTVTVGGQALSVICSPPMRPDGQSQVDLGIRPEDVVVLPE
jgi:iron(III) transport system ATP-binding protein